MDRNKVGFWPTQGEDREAMSVDGMTVDSHRLHSCSVCLYNARCKCDLTMHMFKHRDPLNPNTLKCSFCEYKSNEIGDNFQQHLLSHKTACNKLKCCICDYLSKSVQDLDSHLFVHKDTFDVKFFKCSLCQYKTKTLANLNSHMHFHKTKLKCCLCDREYLSKNELAKHFLMHKDANDLHWYKCDFCDHRSNYVSSLKLHCIMHKDLIEGLTCCICNYRCETEGNLEEHMSLHTDPENVDVFNCFLCYHKTQRLADLKIHLSTHNRPTGDKKTYCICPTTYESRKENASHHKIYYCDQCDYKAKVELTFKNHKSKHQLVKCDVCNLETNGFDRKRHDSIFHSQSENDSLKTFKCCVCNCKYETQGDLAKHLLSHYSKNMCVVCKKKTRTKDQLSWISHMLLHSIGDEMKRHRCDLCTFRTANATKLKYHKETHKDRSQRNLFKCMVCGSDYTTKDSLKFHMEVHKNDLKMSMQHCDRCDYKTRVKSTMVRHKLRHELGKCNLCNAEMNEFDLRMHNEVFHSDCVNDSTTLKCCICDYKSEKKSGLAKHLLSHKNASNICNICGCKSTKEVSWIYHMLVHSNIKLDKKYNCDDCSYVTTKITNFLRHKETHKERSERNIFKCLYCNANYVTKASLKSHLMAHRESADYANPPGVMLYNCDDCDYKTKDESCIRVHKLKHQSVKCSFCNLETENQLEMKRHVEKFHLERLKMFGSCCICHSRFETKVELTKHFSLHKDKVNFSLFKCDTCDYKTRYLNYLKLHKSHLDSDETKNIHQNQGKVTRSDDKFKMDSQQDMPSKAEASHCAEPEIAKVLMCRSCDFKTKSWSYLRVHIRSKHLNKLKCCICDHKFITKLDLARHLLLHKDFKSFKCSSCKHKTRYLAHLKQHLQKHKRKSDSIKVFRCDICQFETPHKATLKRHIEVHKNPSERKYFNCLLCDCRYTTKGALKKHVLRHENVSKMFHCGDCDFKTMHKDSLNGHKLYMHTDPSKLKRFKCDFCGVETRRKNSLTVHVRKFHNGVVEKSSK